LIVTTSNEVGGVEVFAVRSDDSQKILEEVLFSDVEIIAVLVRVERGSGVGNRPGQGVLERGKEVDHSPSNDDLVVERDAVGSDNGSKTDTGKSGVDTTEHTDVTTLELLTHRQLEKHHRDTNEEQT